MTQQEMKEVIKAIEEKRTRGFVLSPKEQTLLLLYGKEAKGGAA